MKFLVIIFLLIMPLGFFTKDKNPVHPFYETGYQPGEKLNYTIRFGPIKGGLATLELEEVVYEGENVYHAKILGKSTGIVDKIHKVKDIYESYFNIETGLPVKSLRNIREGRYRYYNEIIFDRENDIVISSKSGEHPVPKNIQDMVSTFYYIRRLNYDTIHAGDFIKVNTFFDDDIFSFDIRFEGSGIVRTKLGKFNCLKFVPLVPTGKIFSLHKDYLTIWISNDSNLVPIRMKFDLIIGSLKIDLIEYSGLRSELVNLK